MDTTPKCQAHARSGKQCGNYAVKGKRVCKLHGGYSTGPRTAEGLERIKKARIIHGRYSAEAIKDRQEFKLLIQSFQNMLKEVPESI